MATKKITIERFSITSTKPFAEVVSAIAAQVGHPTSPNSIRAFTPQQTRWKFNAWSTALSAQLI